MLEGSGITNVQCLSSGSNGARTLRRRAHSSPPARLFYTANNACTCVCVTDCLSAWCSTPPGCWTHATRCGAPCRGHVVARQGHGRRRWRRCWWAGWGPSWTRASGGQRCWTTACQYVSPASQVRLSLALLRALPEHKANTWGRAGITLPAEVSMLTYVWRPLAASWKQGLVLLSGHRTAGTVA